MYVYWTLCGVGILLFSCLIDVALKPEATQFLKVTALELGALEGINDATPETTGLRGAK